MIVYVKEPIVLYRGQTWSLTTLRVLYRDCTCLEGGRGGISFPSPTGRRTTEQTGARQHLFWWVVLPYLGLQLLQNRTFENKSTLGETL